MIVPSIDLQDGQAVQLIGGETKALDAGDPRPLARRYGLVGEIAVVDLDAALGKGSNAAVVEELIDLAPAGWAAASATQPARSPGSTAAHRRWCSAPRRGPRCCRSCRASA